jgi:hypothetical protein
MRHYRKHWTSHPNSPIQKLTARLLGARSIVFSFPAAQRGCCGWLLQRASRRIGSPALAAFPAVASLHQTLLYLGRVDEAARIADDLDPIFLARARAWIEFGKTPDLAKLETGLQQLSESSQKALYTFWGRSRRSN